MFISKYQVDSSKTSFTRNPTLLLHYQLFSSEFSSEDSLLAASEMQTNDDITPPRGWRIFLSGTQRRINRTFFSESKSCVFPTRPNQRFGHGLTSLHILLFFFSRMRFSMEATGISVLRYTSLALFPSWTMSWATTSGIQAKKRRKSWKSVKISDTLPTYGPLFSCYSQSWDAIALLSIILPTYKWLVSG